MGPAAERPCRAGWHSDTEGVCPRGTAVPCLLFWGLPPSCHFLPQALLSWGRLPVQERHLSEALFRVRALLTLLAQVSLSRASKEPHREDSSMPGALDSSSDGELCVWRPLGQEPCSFQS